MSNIRYLLGGVICAAAILCFPSAQAKLIDISDCRLQKFKVTAYYSPQQSQSFYYKGNYQDEIILNGRGTHGASGRPVFNGMIAAPKNYAFGTKLFFPGYGIGQVEDRGGAIVKKGERGEQYDRIDFWVGRGEEGLKRALSFGVKYLDAYVCDSNKGERVGFDYSKFPIKENFFQQSLWIMQLAKGRTDKWVATLQDYLAALNYHPADKVTGYFGPLTQQSVCEFQQEAIGLSEESIWCGYFGAQTRSALQRSLKRRGLLAGSSSDQPSASDIQLAAKETAAKTVKKEDEQEKEETQQKEADQDAPTGQKEHTGEDQAAKDDHIPLTEEMNQYYLRIGDSRKYQFLSPITFGTKSKEVSVLQRKLQWLGYYTGRISGIYDTPTAQAIYAFQLDKGILSGDEDPSLFGYFGPKTRKTLNSL